MSLLRFRFFKRNLPPKLGRWRTDEPAELIYRKVELATDDHCGSDLCQKKVVIKNKKEKKPELSKFAYEMDPLLPYII
tara:strand:+ start:77 stop:310 length:234 start_codon:yes stop_codon:yes gene_type:complete